MAKQKWINEGGIFFPIPGYATIYNTPGAGVFQIYEDPNNHRLGLEKIAETFEFPFKLYDLGCEQVFQKIEYTWMSKVFRDGNKNLGVIFNGIKGTGKTIAAKVLSNRLGMPVVVVSRPTGGLQEFIQSLCFECVILIDEAEKTFDDDREMLLKMIDGVYNESRKLYILTTNRLTVDENLIGRPGRIRYINQFGNLTAQAVNEFIDDNLEDMTKKQSVLDLVDTLTISTIDILRSIVDEVNIHGEVEKNSMLNIPAASYKLDIVRFSYFDGDCNELRNYILNRLEKKQTVAAWLKSEYGVDKEGKTITNESHIQSEFNCTVFHETVASDHKWVYQGDKLRWMTAIDSADELGFFKFVSDYDDDEELACLVGDHGEPSLYRGSLAY